MNRHERRKMKKDKLFDCKEQLNFFRGEVIRLRKLLDKTATEQIQKLGTFNLIADNGKKIPLKIKDESEVKA